MTVGQGPRSPLTPGAGADNPSLRALRREVDDAAVDHFVADFLDLLDDRLAGLHQLLVTGRDEDAITALLSIETSGLMVGANQLAATAAILRRTLTQGRSAEAAALYDELAAAAQNTRRMLAGH